MPRQQIYSWRAGQATRRRLPANAPAPNLTGWQSRFAHESQAADLLESGGRSRNDKRLAAVWLSSTGRETRNGTACGGVASGHARRLLLRTIRSSLTLTTGQVILAVSAFIFSLLSARLLGLEQRGQLALTLQISYVAGPLLSFGMTSYLLRRPSDVPLIVSLLRFPVLVGLLLSIGAWALHAPWTVVAGFFCAIGGVALLLVRSSLVGRTLPRKASLLQAAVGFLYLAASLILYFGHVDEVTLWLAPYVLLSGAAMVAAVVGATKRERIRGLLRRSAPQVPGQLAMIVALRSDRLLIAAIVGADALATYVMAAVVLEASLWLVNSYADLMVSLNVGKYSSRAALRSVGKSLLPIVVLVGLSAVTTEYLVLPFIGPQYAPVTELLLPLSLATVLLGIAGFSSRWLLASPKPGLASIPSVVQGVCALPVYVFAISHWGVLGAAWGSAVVYGSGTIVALLLLLMKRYDTQG